MPMFKKHKKLKPKENSRKFILKFLLEKEFIQFRRNKFFPKMLVAVPFISLALFPMVANFDVKNIRLVVVDKDHSNYSSRLINKATASGHFTMKGIAENYNAALYEIEQDKADLILEIPAQFEKSLITEGKAQVLIAANTVNGMKGGLSSSYMATIINNFSAEILAEKMPVSKSTKAPLIEIVPHYRFNPHLEYKYTMIPGILMMILAMIVGFLPALNIVGEKEKGTLEQMNVTPASPFIIILSKLIPYWLMGFVVLTIGFFVAWLFYGMTALGSYFLIYLFAAVFSLAFSGFGLAISNYAHNFQQAMFIMFFFVVTFIFLSGLYTPVSSMPEWTQILSRFSPLRYTVEVLRSVFLKGSSFADLKYHFLALCGFAVFFNGWAVLGYRKTT